MQELNIPRLMQNSVEWYTPSSFIKAAKKVLGEIELDPASCEEANQTVRAERFLTKEMDGLIQKWEARSVWLNPPYCKSKNVSNQELWTCKLIAEYEAGHVQEAILLVNAATETNWFQRLYDYPVCFCKRRIRFNSPSGKNSGSTVGSAFVYFGANIDTFISVFEPEIGIVVRRVKPPKEALQLWDIA